MGANGPNWGHALALTPLASSGVSKHITNAFKRSSIISEQIGDNTVIIGKVDDLTKSGSVREGESTLLDPKANWKQNSTVLREAMGLGRPIRDVSVDPQTGELIKNTGFLKAERNLLRNQGWSYDIDTRTWKPPQQ